MAPHHLPASLPQCFGYRRSWLDEPMPAEAMDLVDGSEADGLPRGPLGRISAIVQPQEGGQPVAWGCLALQT